MSKNIKFNEQTRQLTIKLSKDEKEVGKTIVIKIYCPSFLQMKFRLSCLFVSIERINVSQQMLRFIILSAFVIFA